MARMKRQTYAQKLAAMSPAELERERERNMRNITRAWLLIAVGMAGVAVGSAIQLLVALHVLH